MKNKNTLKEHKRYLTPREFARLQGFYDSFKLPMAKTNAYNQMGNSIPIPVAKAVAKEVLKALKINS